jgi:hypothetical protein
MGPLLHNSLDSPFFVSAVNQVVAGSIPSCSDGRNETPRLLKGMVSVQQVNC